ncbi:hypothetical protein GUJ93_ZPchr0001g32094 [Zizania palustris]|uniref:Uncharacterized protein n=1 Tax=Zizania palustris TaxID=103762 RepID=A0A8J5S9G9_ZIZPA|nr:hypothetical protein GUJ93_ZPchr0001g32094 [Zizania palustris]
MGIEQRNSRSGGRQAALRSARVRACGCQQCTRRRGADAVRWALAAGVVPLWRTRQGRGARGVHACTAIGQTGRDRVGRE